MRIFVLSTFLALGASTVQAADVVAEHPAPSVAFEAPAYTWSGAYLGIQGGGGWANGKFSGLGISSSEDANGGLFGAFAGYNYQFDNDLVVGIEGDVEYNWNEQEIFGADFGTDWAGSVRGRVGYAFDRALIYATAGWAATQGYVDVPGLGKDEETFNGYTVGAGLDYAFTGNIFGRIEYRYNDFGKKELQGVSVDVDQHAVKVGLGIKF
ncbi:MULTISPECIES: outer membrane protein [Rhizobium/Agrobacterium group]|uniref:Outer membrane protein n=2 Tax=Neorhizobium TaxID=1525371 RepID=A0ABV0M615_9HYPH|nr:MULTISPECIES: outer membrane protein [Rhizobium/Agrobacterium group]KGE01578.1 membrane protein [Rhizobium sp. YS-1r]MCC2610995.1 porin family protein [Neorhizobium petrolearium]WGI66215.1 porin family protein [Neorhizobium petrolearium]